MPNESPVVQAILNQLNAIKAQYGEDHYKSAAKDAAKLLLRTHPDLADVARDLLGDVVDFNNLDSPQEDIPIKNLSPDQIMAEAIRQQMPSLRTQAQFKVFMSAFHGLRVYMDSTFLGNNQRADDSKKLLLQALEHAVSVTELSQKLGSVPEAAVSKEAEEFKHAPKEFHEHNLLIELLSEMKPLDTMLDFQSWYKTNRSRFELIVSQDYRNTLFDMLRQKKRDIINAQFDA